MNPRPSFLIYTGLNCLIAANLWAQGTNLPTFKLTVTPPAMSLMVTQSVNPVFVKISNLALFTNVTVEGSFAGSNGIAFLDSGAAPDARANDGTFSANITAPPGAGRDPFIETLLLVVRGDIIDTNDPPMDPPPPPAGLTNPVDYVIVSRPENDNFVDAVKIPQEGWTYELSAGYSNNFASLEPREPQHARLRTADASVWWYWSCPAATNVLVDLGGTTFDAVLTVFRGSTVSNLTSVAAATGDTTRGLRAYTTFNAQAFATYRIAVSGSTSNEVGGIRLRLLPGAAPDTFGPLLSIVTPPTESLVTSMPVSFTGTVKEKSLNESGVDRVVLLVNTDTNELDALVFPDIGEWSLNLTNLPPGTNIVRAIGIDRNGNRGPAAAVVVRYLNPLNDLFANAVDLTGVGGVETADSSTATKEPGEPVHARNLGGRSIWYRWQAPYTGDLTLSTEGSDFDTLLALYIGTSLTNLVEVASNDDAYPGTADRSSLILARVVANQVYYIAVDGLDGAGGNVSLSYSFTSTQPLYSVTVATPLGGIVLPANALYPENTALSLLAVPDKNFAFVRWEDLTGNPVSVQNPLPLIMNRNYSFQAVFRLQHYSDTFSTGDLKKLAWTSSGHAPWRVELVDGQYAARSGTIGDRQSSSLVLITNLYAGTASFDVRVSSEAGWDWLEFYLNGARLNRWSGEVPWTNFLFQVSDGANTLEWRYVKDANYVMGNDCAYVDNVYVPLEKPNPPPPPDLSISTLPNRTFQLMVLAQPGSQYVIQVSSNLLSWTGAATNRLVGATWQWTDPTVPAPARRFYRVVAP
jgi:hypothetical protein